MFEFETSTAPMLHLEQKKRILRLDARNGS
jgi:hypothetical protein